MIEWVAAALMVLGSLFCLIAGIGVVRFSDIYMRMHAATKAGTLGLALVAIAAMLLAESARELIEPLVVFLFMIATSPVGAHLVGRAAFRTAIPTAPHTRIEPDCDMFRSEAAPPRESPVAPIRIEAGIEVTND